MTRSQTHAELQAILAAHAWLRLVPASSLYHTNSEQTIIDINTPFCKARCALQGAQLLEFESNNTALLWLSPQAIFDGATAIRGGIPLCLPWFGVNRYRSDTPKHGFARNNDWRLYAVETSATAVELRFQFVSSGHEDFEHPFSADLSLTLSDRIEAAIVITNTGPCTIPISFAFHSYLAVSNSETALVQGLNGANYLDNTAKLQRFSQRGDISFDEEIDRIYENSVNTLHLLDSEGRYQVESTLPTAIIWNPHRGGTSIKDIGTSWKQFICVENGAAFTNEVLLKSGQQWGGNTCITRRNETN